MAYRGNREPRRRQQSKLLILILILILVLLIYYNTNVCGMAGKGKQRTR
jgi:hypothetical protein